MGPLVVDSTGPTAENTSLETNARGGDRCQTQSGQQQLTGHVISADRGSLPCLDDMAGKELT